MGKSLIEQAQATVNSINAERKRIKDWQEFAERAKSMREHVFVMLEAELEAKRKYEADQAELKRLRDEEQKRQQQARDAKIARQAAEQARLEAERKAKAESERQAYLAEKALKDAEEKAEREQKAAAAERQRIEKEKQQAIESSPGRA